MTCVLTSGCLVASSPQACASPNTCQGAAGSASCQCPAAGTIAGSGCANQNDVACDPASSNVVTCALVNGCLVWQQTSDCTSTGLVCRGGPGAPSCNCPDNTSSTFYADAINGTNAVVDGGLAPTGVLSPAGCRFGSLTVALAQANQLNADDGGSAEVVATGAAALANMVFTESPSSLEAFPLVVHEGVTLRTDASGPAGGSYTISFNDAAANVAVVVGNAGTGSPAAVSGFALSFATGANPAASGLNVVGPAELSLLSVSGPGAATAVAPGLDVSGTGAVNQTGVLVSGFNTGEAYNSTATSTLNTVTLESNNVGLDLRAGALTATALSVDTSTTVGITTANVGPGATVTLSMEGGAVDSNGQTGGGSPGVDWRKGSLYLDTVSILNNGTAGVRLSGGNLGDLAKPVIGSQFVFNGQTSAASAGLVVAGGEVTMGTSNTFNSNKGSGLAVTAGAVEMNVPVFDSNGVDGVSVGGGSVTLHSPTVTGNAGPGVLLTGGTLTVDGPGTVDGNGKPTGGPTAAGVRAEGGTLNVGSQSDATGVLALSNNGTVGLHLGGATTNVYYADIHNNAGAGVNVVSNGAVMTVDHTSIHDNSTGVLAIRASRSGNATALFLTNDTINNNGENGINLGNPNPQGAGTTSVDIDTCTVSNSGKVGAIVNQNAVVSILNSDIFANGITGNVATGGIVFAQGATINLTGFVNNKIHGNNKNQVSFAAGTWSIDPGACATLQGAPLANQIYCYANGSFGITTSTLSTVNAQHTSWVRSPPQVNTDYSVATAATVDASNSCGAITTCP